MTSKASSVAMHKVCILSIYCLSIKRGSKKPVKSQLYLGKTERYNLKLLPYLGHMHFSTNNPQSFAKSLHSPVKHKAKGSHYTNYPPTCPPLTHPTRFGTFLTQDLWISTETIQIGWQIPYTYLFLRV